MSRKFIEFYIECHTKLLKVVISRIENRDVDFFFHFMLSVSSNFSYINHLLIL